MALSFPCPDCGTLITVAEPLAGGRTSCPRCGAYVSVSDKGTPTGQHVAAGEPPAAPASASADAGRFAEGLPRWTPTALEPPPETDRLLRIDVAISPNAWHLTCIGLGLMYWGIVGIFLAVLGYVAFLT